MISSEMDYFQYRLLDGHTFKHLGDDSAIDEQGNVIKAPIDDAGHSFRTIKGKKFKIYVLSHSDRSNQYWMAVATDGKTKLVLNCGSIF